MSEFNLSKKWREMGITESEPMFLRKDVKEFIRLLKEKAEEYEWEGSEIIDELAGSELIEGEKDE